MGGNRRKSRRCEVCGVRESLRGGFFANFPKDELRCKTWVKQVGKEDLVHVPIEKLHEDRHVCGDHFEIRDFGKTGKRLKKRAYPKLHLSAPPLSDHLMTEFPQHVASNQVLAANPVKSLPRQLASVESMPSTSKEPIAISITENINAANPIIPEDKLSEHLGPTEPMPSTSRPSTSIARNRNVSAAKPIIPVEKLPVKLAPMEPKPSTSREPLSTSIVQNVNVPTNAKKRFGEPLQVADVKRVKHSHNTARGIPVIDFNERQTAILQKLKDTKSSLRSVRRIVKDIEDLEFPVLKELVTMAMKNKKKKPRGRRWTNKLKIAWLAIYKRSPKAYRYLQHLLPLPSAKTLQNILKKVPMDPGINKFVLEHLSKISKKKKDSDRYCCLLFDEIALKPNLYYNVATDQVEGYTDLGNSQRSSSLADHALVVMLQGLKQKFKQPLAFYFVKGTISSNMLATIIRDNILAVNKTGFHVLATVCDQGPTNMGALKILKQLSPIDPNETTQNLFYVGDKKFYIIYDVPHLFKSLRNNLINYGELQIDGKKAKWQHLVKVHELNKELLYLSKITDTHVYPKYRAKMKVKYAAQLLSNTVAAVLKLVALKETDANVSNEIMQTGEIIHELDRLFDKTNGPSGPADIKKGRRENVSAKTDHVRVWTEFRKKLESLKFVKAGTTVRATNVRCIQGYITTLCSLRDLWHELENLGFKYFNLRQVNQDALENLFGILRQHSPTNSHPTISGFVSALKTAVISKLTAPHSRGSNCQLDGNNLMTDFHDLIFEGGISETNNDEAQSEVFSSINPNDTSENKENSSLEEAEYLLNLPDFIDEEVERELLSLKSQPIVYVSGFIASQILKSNKCRVCKKMISVENPSDDPTYDYIKLREWWKEKNSLTYPSIGLCRTIGKCIDIFENEVIPILHNKNICNLTVTLFMINSDTSFLKCDEHSTYVTNQIYNRLAILLIRRQCQRVNQKLTTQVEDLADKTKKAQQIGVDKLL